MVAGAAVGFVVPVLIGLFVLLVELILHRPGH